MGLNDFVHAMSTHRGRVRAGNEDACDANPDLATFVVCDGMGGALAGEIASHLATQTFFAVLSGEMPPMEPSSAQSGNITPGDRLRDAIRTANVTVYRKAHSSYEFEGMGTTLVSLTVEFRKPTAPSEEGFPDPVGTLWIAHVGDSRCYLHRSNLTHLITFDHSVVEEQVRAGMITRDEAENSPLRHVITRAVGSSHRIDPEIQTVDAYSGDLLLLASDGLNRELTDEDIDHFLSQVPNHPTESDLKTCCQNLIEAVNYNGGHDNVTVLVVHIR